MDLQRRGTLGACVAVLYTDAMQQTFEWLKHYSRLGVEGFDIYWTNSSVTPANDNKTSVPTPFPYPGVRWMQFKHLPLEKRWLYNQQTM